MGAEQGLGKNSTELKTAFVDYMARNPVSVEEGMARMKQEFPERQIEVHMLTMAVRSRDRATSRNQKFNRSPQSIRFRLHATLSNSPMKKS